MGIKCHTKSKTLTNIWIKSNITSWAEPHAESTKALQYGRIPSELVLKKNCSKNNDPPKGQVKMVGASLAWTSDHEWVSFPIIMTHAQEVLSATQEVLTCGLWRVSTLGSRNSHRRWRQQGRGGLATTGISTAWGHQAAPTWWQTAIRRYMPLTHCRKKEGIYIPGSLFSPVDESAAWRADSKRFKRDGSLEQK